MTREQQGKTTKMDEQNTLIDQLSKEAAQLRRRDCRDSYLEVEVTSKTKQLDDEKRETDTLSQEIQADMGLIEEEKQQLVDQLERLKHDIKQETDRMNSKRQSLENIKKQIEETTLQCAEQDKKLKEARQKHAEKEKDLQEWKEKERIVLEKIEKKEKRLMELEKEAQEEEARYREAEAKHSTMLEEMNRLTEESTLLQNDCGEDMVERTKALEKEKSELTEEIATLEEHIHASGIAIPSEEGLQQRIAELQQQKEANARVIEEREAELASAKLWINVNEKVLKEKQKHLDSLTSTLSSLNKERESITAKLKETKHRMERDPEFDHIKAKIQSVRNDHQLILEKVNVSHYVNDRSGSDTPLSSKQKRVR